MIQRTEWARNALGAAVKSAEEGMKAFLLGGLFHPGHHRA
jgi:hypothetical protein